MIHIYNGTKNVLSSCDFKTQCTILYTLPLQMILNVFKRKSERGKFYVWSAANSSASLVHFSVPAMHSWSTELLISQTPNPSPVSPQPSAIRHFLLLDQQVSLVTPDTFICCSEFSHFAAGSSLRYSFASPPPQSSLRAPSFRGPLAALRSARLASSSFLLSSRFFLDSSALLRPAGQWRRAQQLNVQRYFTIIVDAEEVWKNMRTFFNN